MTTRISSLLALAFILLLGSGAMATAEPGPGGPGCDATWTECADTCPENIGSYCSDIAPNCGLQNATCTNPLFACGGQVRIRCEFKEPILN